MDKTDAKQAQAWAGRYASGRTGHDPASPAPAVPRPGLATQWAGRSTSVSSSTPGASHTTSRPAAGRTWAQVAAGMGRGVAGWMAEKGPSQAGRSRLVERKATPLGSPTGPVIETKAGGKAPAQPGAPTVAKAIAGPCQPPEVPAVPLPGPALDAFFQAWVGALAATPSPESRERLFDAMRGFLGGMPTTCEALAPLLRHLAGLPLARLPQLAHEVLSPLHGDEGLGHLPAAIAQARAGLAPALRPALAVLACLHGVLLEAGTMSIEAWEAFLANYPGESAPEARTGARMAIDPMAPFEGDTFTATQRLDLLDAVYAIPGLVTENFIQGSFATAWGVEATPLLRLRLLDQLMTLGEEWVQPGHARVGRTLLDADCRYADQPMPTAIVERIGRWYAATLARAEWATPQQRQDFLEGERRSVLRMSVEDPKAREALLAVLGEPATVRRADGKIETKSRSALSLDDDEA